MGYAFAGVGLPLASSGQRWTTANFFRGFFWFFEEKFDFKKAWEPHTVRAGGVGGRGGGRLAHFPVPWGPSGRFGRLRSFHPERYRCFFLKEVFLSKKVIFLPLSCLLSTPHLRVGGE